MLARPFGRVLEDPLTGDIVTERIDVFVIPGINIADATSWH